MLRKMKTDAAEVRVIADTMAPEDDVKDKISVEAQLLIDVLGKSNKKIKDFDVAVLAKRADTVAKLALTLMSNAPKLDSVLVMVDNEHLFRQNVSSGKNKQKVEVMLKSLNEPEFDPKLVKTLGDIDPPFWWGFFDKISTEPVSSLTKKNCIGKGLKHLKHIVSCATGLPLDFPIEGDMLTKTILASFLADLVVSRQLLNRVDSNFFTDGVGSDGVPTFLGDHCCYQWVVDETNKEKAKELMYNVTREVVELDADSGLAGGVTMKTPLLNNHHDLTAGIKIFGRNHPVQNFFNGGKGLFTRKKFHENSKEKIAKSNDEKKKSDARSTVIITSEHLTQKKGATASSSTGPPTKKPKTTAEIENNTPK